MNLYKRLICLLLPFCLLLPLCAQAQGAQPGRIVVVEQDTTTMPHVTLRMGLFDRQGQPVTDLLAQDIQVVVDSRPLTTTPALVLDARPPAVVIVADFSAGMSDQSVPGQSRLDAMIDQVGQLLGLLPKGTPVTLITAAAQASVELDWRVGNAELSNTLAALKSNGLPAAAQQAPYPLTEALVMGLQQFAKPEPLIAGRPRTLIVYAAGAAGQNIDSAALGTSLGMLEPNQPAITFVGLGGSAAGQFATLPGNPAALAQAASALPGAVFLPFFSANAGQVQLLRNDLDARYRTIANMSGIYTLSFEAGALPAGAHTVNITARGATTSLAIQVPILPPKVAIRVPDTPLRDRAQLRVDVLYRQRPIAQVEYFVDGRSIGVATEGPDFVYGLDLAKLAAPDGPLAAAQDDDAQHELSAIATDVDGRQSPRSSASQVSIVLPKPFVPWVWLVVALGLLVLVLAAFLAVVLLKQSRQRQQAHTDTPSPLPPNPFDERTKVAGGPGSLPPGFDRKTEIVASASGRSLAPRLRVTILTGADYQEFELPEGPKWAVGRHPNHAISIKNEQVSSKHAELTMASDGVKLTALQTTNGTFIGEDKHPIAPGQSKVLRFGEAFWIGPNIKLKVEQC